MRLPPFFSPPPVSVYSDVSKVPPIPASIGTLRCAPSWHPSASFSAAGPWALTLSSKLTPATQVGFHPFPFRASRVCRHSIRQWPGSFFPIDFPPSSAYFFPPQISSDSIFFLLLHPRHPLFFPPVTSRPNRSPLRSPLVHPLPSLLHSPLLSLFFPSPH